MPRFQGIEKLYGPAAGQLAHAHVLVVGLGGVGSWAAEALARSGIGAITMIDGDDICVTNTNRQLHALEGQIGRPKVEVMAERLRAIHPDCKVTAIQEFFAQTSVEKHLATKYDFVIDAIDGISNKAWLIAGCRERGIPVVTCGGAGGRRDPSKIIVGDLSETSGDRLLMFLRKKLRYRFGFPRGHVPFGIPCVYSQEPIVLPADVDCPTDEAFEDADAGLACDGRLGSATFVTGTFGFMTAAVVVNAIAAHESHESARIPNKRKIK